MRIGIVGQGGFGTFLRSLMPADCQVITYDSAPKLGASASTTLDEVLDVDVLIPAIPLSSYNDFFSQIADKLRPETLVIDVCSVKTVPERRIEELLPNHSRVLMTHPLFGPQSAARSTRGHALIVTRQQAEDELAAAILRYCEQTLGLTVTHMTAEEHDRTMAQVHALTFFAAHGLASMPENKVQFMTPSYQKVLDLVALDQTHSQELFRTIQLGNPFAQEVREQLIDSLVSINEDLKSAAL